MSTDQSPFQALLSDDVFVTGMTASDVRSLWRALARTQDARSVARHLGSDRDRIRELCEFLEALLKQAYDKAYRHPDDMALCAGLILLEQSPLSVVRNLFSRLRNVTEPSLVWVRRMAEYCEERFVACARTELFMQQDYPLHIASAAPESSGVHWRDSELEASRRGLKVVA